MTQGRWKLYESPEQMQEVIDQYFDEAEDKPTIAGLAVALGMTRQSLLNYERDSAFFDTVKRAKSRVEARVEERLTFEGGGAGCIFNLKNNFGWVDKTETDINAKVAVEDLIARLDAE